MGQSQYSKLSNILDALPGDDLVDVLTAPTGRPGHGVRTLFRAYVASFVLNTCSISAALRRIQDDPRLAAIVGGTPTKQAVSRFLTKLKDHPDLLDTCMTTLVDGVREFLPDLGEHIALDSTDIKAWSGVKRTDPDAASGAKKGNDGRLKWWFGYKAHMIADPVYEIPLGAFVLPANLQDVSQVPPSMALVESRGLRPAYVLADAGYDSYANIQFVEDMGAAAIIKRRNLKNRTLPRPTKEWEALYSKRGGIERVFGRLKDFRRLNRLTLKGLAKATMHCLCAILALLAGALAALLLSQPGLMRCVA